MGQIKCAYCGADFLGEFDSCPYCGEKVTYISDDALSQSQDEQENENSENIKAQAYDEDADIQGIDIEKLLFGYHQMSGDSDDVQFELLNNNIPETAVKTDESQIDFYSQEQVDEEDDTEFFNDAIFDLNLEKQQHYQNDESEEDDLEFFVNNDEDIEESHQFDMEDEPAKKTTINNSAISSIDRFVSRNPLTNELKVLLTSITVVLPGLGQIIGIICAIIFMNAVDDQDRQSFGKALLVTALIMFVLVCLSSFAISFMLAVLEKAVTS